MKSRKILINSTTKLLRVLGKEDSEQMSPKHGPLQLDERQEHLEDQACELHQGAILQLPVSHVNTNTLRIQNM